MLATTFIGNRWNVMNKLGDFGKLEKDPKISKNSESANKSFSKFASTVRVTYFIANLQRFAITQPIKCYV